MAINNISGRIPGKPANPKTAAPSANKETVIPNGSMDKIHPPITERVKKALTASSEAPVNSERVASLKQAISEGSYKIDADSIAKKIIQFENALLK